jgi:hypothetical protein
MTQEIIFTKEECKKIIEFYKETDYKILNNDEPSQTRIKYKGYQIKYSNDSEFLYKKLFEFFEKNTGKKIYTYPTDIYIMQYDEGDLFSQHTDNIDERVYVTGVQLNDDYVGGDYIFYEETGLNIVINKEIGNCYVCGVHLSHEVKKITKGTRYSLVAFIRKISLTDKNKKVLI